MLSLYLLEKCASTITVPSDSLFFTSTVSIQHLSFAELNWSSCLSSYFSVYKMPKKKSNSVFTTILTWNFEEQVLVKFFKIKFNTFRGNIELPDHGKTNLSKKLVNRLGYYLFFAFCCLHMFLGKTVLNSVKFWNCYLVQAQDWSERVLYELRSFIDDFQAGYPTNEKSQVSNSHTFWLFPINPRVQLKSGSSVVDGII